MKKLLFAILLACLFLPGCGRKTTGASPAVRAFPEVKPPSVMDATDVEDYAIQHFWDSFLAPGGDYLCDSLHVEGVDTRALAAQTATYLSVLQSWRPEEAPEMMEAFFAKLENYQAADSLSNVFSWMCETVGYYLYDPNSPIRNEELYLPFVSALADSPMAPDSLRRRYLFEKKVCSTCRPGTVAPDLTIICRDGSAARLHSQKAGYTVLVFLNPGCNACEEAKQVFGGETAKRLCSDGVLKVFSVCPDGNTEEWQKNSGSLPDFWTAGYEALGAVNEDHDYYVRGIPSIYLLDADKKIILKDAAPSAAANYLENAIGR